MSSAADLAPALRCTDLRRSFRTGKRVVAALDGISATPPRAAGSPG